MMKFFFWHLFYWTSVLIGVAGFVAMFLVDPSRTWPGIALAGVGLGMFFVWNVADYHGWTQKV